MLIENEQTNSNRIEHDMDINIQSTKVLVHCSCGAVWTHTLRETQEDIENTFLAHVRYFGKPKIAVW